MALQSVYKVLQGSVACMLLLVNTAGTTALPEGSSRQPTLLQAVAPVYPAVAALARVSAAITLEAQINAGGKVTSSRIIEGHKLLDKAAENAARRWVFAASKDEAARTARLIFTFTLMPEGTPIDELSPVFVPPYRVEVRRTIPEVVNSSNIGPLLGVERCRYWQAKVDPSVTPPEDITEVSKEGSAVGSTLTFEINEEDAANVLEATECLLKLRGKTSPSTYSSGTVGYHLSTRFPPPTVEVAALYYVSYLHHKKWRHAQAMVLVDKEGKRNTKKSVKTAYKAYQSWFERVKAIGLENARRQNLAPLDGAEVSWY